MKIIQFLLFLPLLTSAYNLSPKNAVVYKAPSTKNERKQKDNSYFGYEVLLYSSKATNESWIIVGAPKANYTKEKGGNEIPAEPGVTYRCSLSGECQPLNIKNPDDEIGFVKQVGLDILIKKEHGWLGAAMSLHETSLTICAPRTIVRIYDSLTPDYQNSMHGVCYEGDLISESFDIEDKNFTTFDFTAEFWYNPINGFAVHYPSPKVRAGSNAIRPVVGSPKRGLYGTVQVIGQKNAAELPVGDDLSQFGYALSSGYYFHEDQLMVAGSAPGWQYVGQVAIMDPRTDPVSIIATVDGKEAFEYFGASLATGDINNDGLDDLIVGAPYWKNDNGRVHIFLGNRAGFYEADLFVEGRIDDGLFGYAVTSGDLDNDGFDDIIISAPWEESGVIYVYNGHTKLTSNRNQDIVVMEPSQRIAASSIDGDLLRFGFSISKPVDMDNNGFLDIGLGAYGSGHAVILLSRPAMDSEPSLWTVPTTLPRNATNFKCTLCWDMAVFARFRLQLSEFKLAIDADYKRVNGNTFKQWKDLRTNETCYNVTVNLKKDIRNYVDPISIVFVIRYKGDERGNLLPIEYKGVSSRIVQTKLAFDIGCGLDDICHASIWAKLEFEHIRNSTWIIGSGDLRLMLSIGNHAEPAYLTTVTFKIPKVISLRSILPSCQEEIDSDSTRITCDVGNPLRKDGQNRVILDLDMSHMDNSSADGTQLIFHVDIKTRSVNRGVQTIAIPLRPKADASVALSGKAYDDSYYFNHNEKFSNVSLQHSYQISRFGATPISEARLSVRVPWKLGDSEYLTIFHKPRISILDRFHECSVSNIPVSTLRILAEKGLIEKTNDKEFHFDSIANNSPSRHRRSEDSRLTSDTTSYERLSNFNVSESDGNSRSDFYKMPDGANAETTYLNCSTPHVICGEIVCNIPTLKSAQNVVKFQLQLVIDSSKLPDGSNERGKVIHFTTEARVDVQNSTDHLTVPGTGLIVTVTTKFHRMPHNEISMWIIVGSILLGLVALCLLAVALKKIGFFKRNEKDKLESLRGTEAIPLESEEIFI